MPKTTTIKDERKPRPLYLGDNGRMTCADPGCAGATAAASGMRRDLSGQPMQRLGPADIKWLTDDCGAHPTCETCGAPAAA